MTKLYLAGPMAGYPDHNFPAFNAEAASLRALGYEVINPAEINTDYLGKGRAICMRRDIEALMTCDVIAMMPNWQASKGASCEYAVAEQIGMMIVLADQLQGDAG